ncbi:MAG: XRE family transcriptional regulator [Bacteroidetes bacterium]|nr:XRE family transcriptional regulator [Bacteroidota bacterium]
MSTVQISTESIGEKLRKLRKEKSLSLRKVAALLDIDVAILSKMERGERRVTKEIVKRLAIIYKYDLKELMVIYLSGKVLNEVGNDELALKALQLAEEQIEYKVFRKKDRTAVIKKLTEVIRRYEGIKKAWIYGSFSRKDDGPKSDIDIAVQTVKQFSYFDLADVQYHAEKAVDRKVDIGFIDAFKPHILENIKPDLKLIYEKR